ncbi:MAG: ribosome biogenesis GTP-binding protein YihA/YsxC [Anaerolineales bacterium]|nr:ribosome biogenesis GTP-binding protein YihA/YsxC [Anaerolineales bacterium]
MDYTNIHTAKYIGSFPDYKSCPAGRLPEYAFIGRSNVGKSSLINMLCGRRDLARTSKTPGKTQSINLFVIDGQWQIADLPGYGYAKVSKTDRKRWQRMIEEYMLFRENLVTAFVLVDLRHELQDLDREFINWLGARQVAFSIVFTKADKLKEKQVPRHVERIKQELLQDWEALPPMMVTSSVRETGREALLEYIAELNARLLEE